MGVWAIAHTPISYIRTALPTWSESGFGDFFLLLFRRWRGGGFFSALRGFGGLGGGASESAVGVSAEAAVAAGRSAPISAAVPSPIPVAAAAESASVTVAWAAESASAASWAAVFALGSMERRVVGFVQLDGGEVDAALRVDFDHADVDL